jgi:ABC-type glycerol-3-phosphate transport system substrate-binding protein
MLLHKTFLHIFSGLCLLAVLPACTGGGSSLGQVTAEAIGTPTLTPEPTPIPLTLTPVGTPQPVEVELSVWMPETLAPARNTDVQALFANQIQTFQAARPNVTVERRLKKAEGQGGLVETLISASAVAPNDVPDLVLIHQDDLPRLVTQALAKRLDNRLPEALLDSLYPSVLPLGAMGSQLYGLPYALEIQHVAYQPPPASFAQFEDVLSEGRELVLPVGQVNSVSEIFLAQYLAAGGTLVDGGFGPLNAEALQTVLEFYEQAVAAGIIDPVVLDYPTPQDYLAGLLDGRIRAAVVTSGMYLDLLETGTSWRTDSIPVSSGQPTTILDGWVWVLTANDADHQEAALQFLEWLFTPARHGAYTRAVHMLPSAQAAMRAWGNPSYTAFAGNLLNNAVLPLADNESNPTALAMQSALASVISGIRTAEQATRDVINQISS